eukprot:CAMPEP_0198651964 /NCGR_PEP_ID=MMETSP1467-20131203/6041_1 /TAXON_ID=1462469 /ORGANISM="unid. sp., Strain CCMP2135" /LENGTH=364 /DNA_ID=CAMNT_0044387869 /DNA_START=80 /DNA_END=1174 /DNA_ORIENTATION=+
MAAALNEGIKKLVFLERTTTDAIQRRDEMSVLVGDELTRILREQQVLEQQYESLILERTRLKAHASKSRFKAVQAQIWNVSTALRESTKSLCRNLQDSPTVSGNLLKIECERSTLIQALTMTSVELDVQHAFEALSRYVMNSTTKFELLQVATQRKNVVSEAVGQLDGSLIRERYERQLQAVKLKGICSKLKQDLLIVRADTGEKCKLFQKRAYANACAEQRAQLQSLRCNSVKHSVLSQKRVQEACVNVSSSQYLTSKQVKLLQDWEDWKRRHAVNVMRIQSIRDQIVQERVFSLQKLADLKLRLQSDRGLEAEVRRLAARKEDTQKRRASLLRRRNLAAIYIQRAVRAFTSSTSRAVSKGVE